MSSRVLDDYYPNDIADYAVDFARWLPSGVSVSSAAWAITPSGSGHPTVTPQGVIGSDAIVRVSNGGVDGTRYAVACTATMSSGEVKTETIYFRCSTRQV